MKQEREQKLISRLSAVQEMSLGDAMALLDISESTARRMFAKLESDGYAIRVHGGIKCLSRAMTLYSFEHGSRKNMEQKTAIARRACELLEDGDVIYCDSGTTIQCFCAELSYHVKQRGLGVRIYTNSLANLERLAPHMSVTLIGGEYRENRKDFCGYIAEQALSGLYFTKCFVGADGCARGREFTTTDFECARMNELAIRNSEKSVMLVDSSKFGVFSHVSYVSLESLSTVITDTGAPESVLEEMRRSAEVIAVAPQPDGNERR